MNSSRSAIVPPNLAGGKPAAAGQFLLERRRRLALSLLAIGRADGAAAGHLVDFGCGNGAQTLVMGRDFLKVTGTDLQEEFLAEFRRSIEGDRLQGKFEAVRLDDGRIPLPDGCADVVTCFAVLEHVPQEGAALAEMRRVLRPGGRLVVSVPNRWWIFETHGADLPLLPWNRVPLVSWWPKRLHDRWARARIYRRGELLELLLRAGFTVDAVTRLTAPMDMLPGRALRAAARTTLFRSDRTTIPFLATEIMAAATR